MASAMLPCADIDSGFGPHAGECRGGFDFTLFFEETILSIVPVVLLFLIAPIRIHSLLKTRRKVVQSSRFGIKLALYTVFFALHVALTVLWAKSSSRTPASLPTAVLLLVGSFLLCLLSYAEHVHSVRPSSLVLVYMFFSLLFDIAHTRTLWLQRQGAVIPAVSTTVLVLKFLILVLESIHKRSILQAEFRDYPHEATSGIFNRSFFWWINSLLITGYSKVVSVDDLFTLDKKLGSGYLQKLIHSAWEKATRHGDHSLLTTVVWTLRWPLLAVVPPRICLIGFNFCQPFLINRAIALSQEPVTAQTANIGYGLIGAYILVYMGIAITTGQYQHLTYRAITMARGGLISLLYSKSTDLGISAVDPAASLTLMSADIERITTGWQTMHEIWANLVEIGISIYLLERQLGAACAVPIAVAIVSMVCSLLVTSMVMTRQALWLEAIEKRVATTAAMLGSMKGVKMWGLTDLLFSSIHKLRVDELNVSKGFRKLLIWNMAFTYITPVIAPILTFAVFSILAKNKGDGDTLDINKVFTSLSLFALLTEPLGSFIMAVATFMGSVGCFSRIQEFLSKDGHMDYRDFPYENFTDDDTSSCHVTKSRENSFPHGKEVGRVQLPPQTDKQQETKSSIRDAIVVQNANFGWEKGTHILNSIDIAVPRGKFTMLIGHVGCGKSTLLKGLLGELPVAEGSLQFSSASVAYCDQTPWHMNGNIRQSIIGFSPVDEVWYQTVVEVCTLDDDLRQLKQGDLTEIGSKGIALSGGQNQRIALARAVYAQREILILDDIVSGLDVDTENRVFHNLLGHNGLLRRQDATVLLASSSAKRVPYADHIIVMGTNGKISEHGSFDDLNQNSGHVSALSLPAPDWSYTWFSKDAEKEMEAEAIIKANDAVITDVPTPTDQDSSRQMGDLAIYGYYARSIGWFPTLLFAAAIIGFVFCMSFPNIWVKWWATANVEAPNERLGYYLGIYAMLGVLALICLVISCWQMIITMVPLSGEKFHWTLLKTVLSAPMSFFSTTDTGITLNRFSQDLQLIDMELPISALNTFATFVLVIAQMVIIGVSSVYAAISFPVCIITLYLVQRFYLRTSRQLRLLDIEAKSPLYSQFVECLSGLATIRAFGWQGSLQAKNREILDYSQRPFYLLFSIQRWLTLVLDFMVAGVAVLLIILVVKLRGSLSVGYVGVALLNVIMFSQNIKLLLTFWTMLETHIGAITRVKTFTDETMGEDGPTETDHISPSWPAAGAIRFDNVSAAYKSSELVLKNINFSIEAGEKIALCGRTGSGKSSLVLSIFRMIELTSGTITIDGIDISTIPRQDVRSRIIGVPQDPYLMNETVRINADPTNKNTDMAIINALKRVKLWDIINAKGGLDIEIEQLHLSHGQKQLFCLARAMMRESSILILDEATSVVDNNTDDLMQDVIRERFHNHTIITIAHKLDTILDYDRVAVLDAGRIVEFGNPDQLLSRPSAFSKLYNSSQKMQENTEEQD